LRVTTELDACQSLKKEHLSEISEIEEEEQGVDEELKEGKAVLAKLNKQIATNDKQFAEKDKRLTSCGPQLSVAKERIRKLEKRLVEQEKVKVNMTKDQLAQEETIAGLREDITALKEAESEIDQQLAQESATLHLVSFIVFFFVFLSHSSLE
jgi:predicted  nucleic acid-binding Zn-ribbon protein